MNNPKNPKNIAEFETSTTESFMNKRNDMIAVGGNSWIVWVWQKCQKMRDLSKNKKENFQILRLFN